VRNLLKKVPPLFQTAAWSRVGKAVFTVVVVAIVAGHYPAFAERDDFVGLRARALDMYATQDAVDLFQWLRTQAEATDVFLAPDNVGLAIVGAAGRKLVVVDPFFSNPYVDWGDRDAARQAMWTALATGRCGHFHEVVERYRVSHVILVESVTPVVDNILRTCDLEPTFWTGQYTVLGVTR